jgi:hypothetical protein
MPALTTAAIIAGAASKGLGAINSFRSQNRLEKQLAELGKKPMARYTISPEVEKLYRQAVGEASAPEGFGGANINAFRQNLGRFQRGRFNQALSMSGGSGARGINAVLNAQGLDSINQFAVGDENMRRSNRLSALGRAGTYAGQFQSMRDRNAANDINYRMMLERALGQGIQSQRDFRTNMLSGLGSDLITAGVMGMDGDKDVDITEEVLPKGGGIDYNRLTPRSKFLMGRNPFRQSTGLTDGTLTTDIPIGLNTSGQSKFMYGNK